MKYPLLSFILLILWFAYLMIKAYIVGLSDKIYLYDNIIGVVIGVNSIIALIVFSRIVYKETKNIK
jgi:hypothetical protein